MRILMLAQNYAPIIGGEERLVEDLSVELVTRGHRVAVATIGMHGRQSAEIRDEVRLHRLRSSLYRARRLYKGGDRPQAPPVPDPLTVLDLGRVVRRERPDVVHAHNWLVHSYLPLRPYDRSALVVSLHDYGLICATKRLLHHRARCSGPGLGKCISCATDHYRGGNGALVALGTLSRAPVLRRKVDLFLPVSEAVRDSCGLGDEQRSIVVPNFVRARSPGVREDVRLDLLPSEPFILFLGDGTFDKGASRLIAAYQALEAPPPLVMIGRCEVDIPGDRRIIALGAWPHDLAQEALRRALFVVVPTIMPEAFGLVALESAAAAKAVVASAVGALGDLVIHEETGLLVEPDDVSALQYAMGRLVADASLRECLSRGARLRAMRYSADLVVPAFENAYRIAIETRRRRR